MNPDLTPAARIAADVILGIRDEQLTTPTPCGGITVAELLDHVDSLCSAFSAAATKTTRVEGSRAPTPDASRLGHDWRERLPTRLDELAQSWQQASAWTGTTEVGGNTLPAEVAGAAALNEVIVHGWDLAVATGQPYADDPELAAAMPAAFAWVSGVVEQNPQGSTGLFGPPVLVPETAPMLDRLIGLTGRQPSRSGD